ncbi:MAG TPA: flagellar biosynthesis protein [Burkholderiaceae bacterium]|nr:flagellar biosynthesis protein [Burkholderiaceae bacterium]
MRDFLASDRSPLEPPADQADGLRRLFGHGRTRFVAVAANAEVAFSALALERLAAACAGPGQRVLVVDAAPGSPAPHEMAALDLAAGVEVLTPQLSVLAARGLPLRHVDARGSCAGFLQAVADAAPQCQVVIVHAEAAELGRLFARREACPLLLAADHPSSVTSAYANLKLLAQRHGLMAFDLLLVAAAHSPRTPRIVEQLRRTADQFVGAVLRHWAVIDPGAAAGEPHAALDRLAQAQLERTPGAIETSATLRRTPTPLGVGAP